MVYSDVQPTNLPSDGNSGSSSHFSRGLFSGNLPIFSLYCQSSGNRSSRDAPNHDIHNGAGHFVPKSIARLFLPLSNWIAPSIKSQGLIRSFPATSSPTFRHFFFSFESPWEIFLNLIISKLSRGIGMSCRSPKSKDYCQFENVKLRCDYQFFQLTKRKFKPGYC